MLNTKKGQVCFTPLYILSRGQTSIPDWLKFSALSSSATWRIWQTLQGHTYLGSSVHRKWLFPHFTYIFFVFIYDLSYCLEIVFELGATPMSAVNFVPEVNFINILRAAFSPIFFRQKITKPNCN